MLNGLVQLARWNAAQWVKEMESVFSVLKKNSSETKKEQILS